MTVNSSSFKRSLPSTSLFSLAGVELSVPGGGGGGLVSQHKMVCKKKNDRLDLTGIQIRGGGGGSGPLNFLSNALVRLQIELSACCLHDCYNHLGHILI